MNLKCEVAEIALAGPGTVLVGVNTFSRPKEEPALFLPEKIGQMSNKNEAYSRKGQKSGIQPDIIYICWIPDKILLRWD